MSPTQNAKVELHIHLDGAIRPTTIWELSKQKGLPLPGDGSLDALKNALVVKTPTTLRNILSKFEWILPPIEGDPTALERVAYELCEDKFKEGVMYMEMRASPHLLVGKQPSLTPREVMKCIVVGMQRGENDFGIKCRFIICCMRNLPEYALDAVELCDEFRDHGVVGIDVAGDEAEDVNEHNEEHFHEKIIAAYQEAYRRGIHRTVHVCESGPPNGLSKALDLLSAERIGHGYRVLDDPEVYKKAIKEGIHFETCPTSSILTGAVQFNVLKHPVVKFAEDEVSFSISTDDPTIMNSKLQDEYQLLYRWGLSEIDVVRANISAIRASFMTNAEKEEFINRLEKLMK